MSDDRKAIGRAPQAVLVQVLTHAPVDGPLMGFVVGDLDGPVDDVDLLDDLAGLVDVEEERRRRGFPGQELSSLLADGHSMAEARRELRRMDEISRRLIDAMAIELLRRGVRQAVLAEVFGISRQAVSKKYGHLVDDESVTSTVTLL